MKRFATFLAFGVTFLSLLVSFTGCESDGGGSVGVGVSAYYGVGFYDPWYYGSGYYPPDVIVTPPPEHPGQPPDRPQPPPRPAHPIAMPPPARPPTPAPRPMPSIPSRPRPAGRR